MKIKVKDRAGTMHELEALEGWSVMEIIRDHGLPIKAECGGACCCATCHVYVADEWVDKIPAKEEDEEEMLDEAIDVQEPSRLSCQLLMSEAYDGLEVTLAPEG